MQKRQAREKSAGSGCDQHHCSPGSMACFATRLDNGSGLGQDELSRLFKACVSLSYRPSVFTPCSGSALQLHYLENPSYIRLPLSAPTLASPEPTTNTPVWLSKPKLHMRTFCSKFPGQGGSLLHSEERLIQISTVALPHVIWPNMLPPNTSLISHVHPLTTHLQPHWSQGSETSGLWYPIYWDWRAFHQQI